MGTNGTKPPTARQTLDETTSEKDWQQVVVELARRKNWYCYHTYDSRKSEPGFPDLVCVRDGVVIFAELKVGKKPSLTKSQEAWQARLIRVMMTSGGSVKMYVWMPRDWPAVKEALN